MSKEYKDRDGNVFCTINDSTKRGTYTITGQWQSKFVQKVELDGFGALPTGFYTSGAGLTGAGFYLLRALGEKFKAKLRVRVSATKANKLGKAANITVTLNHEDLRKLNKLAADIKQQRNEQTDREAIKALAGWFPSDFKTPQAADYRPGSIAQQIESKDVFKQLSPQDVEALARLYPKVAERLAFSSTSLAGTLLVAENIRKTQKIQLKAVREEFARMLKSQPNEGTWQKFLRSHILLFLRSYAAVIEKQNIAIAPRIPDFLLLDPYGYVDVFEIKRPQTTLLVYDKSHDNHYWHAEMAKAIAQVENYLDAVSESRLHVEKHLRSEGHEDVRLLRPRGYIIAGRRSDLDKKQQNDMRVLTSGLTNIDVIFYDDLLSNLDLLLDRLGGVGRAKKRAKKGPRATKPKNKTR